MVVDMSGETIVLVVACALIDTDGRVLISQRPEGKAMQLNGRVPAARSSLASVRKRRSSASSGKSSAST